MGTHERERENHVPSRRQALRTIGISSLVAAVPVTAVALAVSPQERIARAVREIESALAELYPGAYRQPILELPAADAFASPLFPDGTFMSGRMAMVSVSANSFHERYAAGLVCREDHSWFSGRAQA